MNSELGLNRHPCPLCGCETTTPVLTGFDREHDLAGAFAVEACTSCGHAYLNPRPDDDDIHLLYPDDYAPFTSAGKIRELPVWRRRVEGFLHVGPATFRRRRGRLLEVGCGRGAMLAQSRLDGWTVTGIEPNDAAAENARAEGLDVRTGTDQILDDITFEPFDEIHAFMVVEHTPDPVETLRRLRRNTVLGGRLTISVPNFAHASREEFGQDWFPLQVPRHLQHFTPETIRQALEAAGWQHDRTWHQPAADDAAKSLRLRLERTGEVGASYPAVRPNPWRRGIALVARCMTVRKRGSSRITVHATAR